MSHLSLNMCASRPSSTTIMCRFLKGVFSRAVQSDPREPRPSHVIQKVSGILARAIKRMERLDDMFDSSVSWKDVQELVRVLLKEVDVASIFQRRAFRPHRKLH